MAQRSEVKPGAGSLGGGILGVTARVSRGGGILGDELERSMLYSVAKDGLCWMLRALVSRLTSGLLWEGLAECLDMQGRCLGPNLDGSVRHASIELDDGGSCAVLNINDRLILQCQRCSE